MIAVQFGHLRVSGAQILVRIYGHVVDAHFVVEMRTSRSAGLAHIADHLTLLHMLAR